MTSASNVVLMVLLLVVLADVTTRLVRRLSDWWNA
jgi:hypothetical protein